MRLFLSKVEKLVIPLELRQKVPSAQLAFYSSRQFFQIGSIVTALVMIWIGARYEKSGWAFVVDPIIYSWIAALYCVFFPRNPYRGTVVGYSTALNGLDRVDKDAKHLVEIYKSPRARRFIAITATQISVVLLICSLIVMFVQDAAVTWETTFNFLVFGPMELGCLIGSFLYIGTVYSAWGFQQWLDARYSEN